MSNSIQKDSFILYKDSLSILEKMTDEQAGILFKNIANFQNTGFLPKLDILTEIAITPFINQFERDNIKYKKVVERNQNNGKNGGRPKTQYNPKNPVGYFQTQYNPIEPKKADSDNDSDNDNDSDYKKNNIKKENDFAESVVYNLMTTDFIESSDPQIHILTENDNQNPVNYNKKTSDPTLSILETDTNKVVIERNKQYSQNDLITNEMMVLDCFVTAGIDVFNDGQFGFGSQLVKDISLEQLYDKTAIMQWGKFKILNQKTTLTICEANNATYKQLYNVIYETFQKGYKNLNYINSYLDKELKKINQLTSTKNDNTIQRNTNISGGNQQEQSGSTERYITAGTTTNYGTGAEALQQWLADNVK